MAKPRVFISSTYFDFKNVRDDLDRFVKSLGYEAVRHEVGQVPYERLQKLESSCYKEVEHCDILVCLIGGRFGSTSHESSYSITQKELKTALEAGKQVYIFIDAPVYHEHDFYLDNKDVNNTKFRHANNIKIHEFIEEINLLNQGNIIFPFNTTSEIIKILQEQWAGLFQRLLIESSNSSHINMISELKQSLQAASQITEFLSCQRTSDSTAIEHIISTNHPLFSVLRKKLNTPYRIYFETKEEIDQWLKVRNYTVVDPAACDDDKHFEWVNAKDNEIYMWLLKINKRIFDETAKLVPVDQANWKESYVSLEKRRDLAHETFDDDIPF